MHAREGVSADAQRAHVTLAAGSAELDADVRVTPLGLLAIGGLVSAILLSTAVLVRTAVNAAGRTRSR
jgi:hypothetical protein